MSSRAVSLKGKINNYTKANHIAAQVVLQNFMFERLLARLSDSAYQNKFVVKGGMLVAAIVGLDTRSTMDLDITLRNLPLTEGMIRKAFEEIIAIDKGDEITFLLKSVEPIRKDDAYGGHRVRIDARYDSILVPLSIDVSTGDAMTPSPVFYEFKGIFDDDVLIPLWGYNIETILAEKLETILRRGVFSTRPKDFMMCTFSQLHRLSTRKRCMKLLRQRQNIEEVLIKLQIMDPFCFKSERINR